MRFMMLRKHISDNYINNQSFFGESKKGSQQRKNNSNSRSGFRPNKLFVVYDCFGKLPSNTTMVKLISFYVFIHLFTFSCPSLLRTSRNCLSRNQPNMFISRAGGGSRKWVSFSSHTSTFKYVPKLSGLLNEAKNDEGVRVGQHHWKYIYYFVSRLKPNYQSIPCTISQNHSSPTNKIPHPKSLPSTIPETNSKRRNLIR